MKLFRYLFAFLSMSLVLVSCEEEEINIVLDGISAPSNLGAIFDISDDDSGTVTVTPTGVGASSFDIFWGDAENETPTDVAPGETVTHVYAEGVFTLRIVAVGPTGLTSELSRVITVSFTPPSNLSFTAEISNDNPFEVTVTPTANDATVFDVFFGDVEEETPVTIMAGESATKIYAEAGDYTIRVVARGASATTIELEETITITGASDPLVLPITFDDANVNYAATGFGGASYEVILNPDPSGANAVESNVGAITTVGDLFQGATWTLSEPADFSTPDKVIAMKVWSNVAFPVLLKLEEGPNGERANEVLVQHGGTGWEMLSFDFATDAVKSFIDGSQGVGEPFVPEGEYDGLSLFLDFNGSSTAGTFYVDDIEKPVTSLPLPQLPLTFESMDFDFAWAGFGAADFGPVPVSVIDNPDASGANTSAKVVEIHKTAGAQTFAGASLQLDGPIDFTEGTTIEIKVWSPRVGTVNKLKIEDTSSPADGNGNPTVFAEVDVASTVANEWEVLTFDLTNPVAGAFDTNIDFDRIVLFPDFGQTGQDEFYYYDDVQIEGTGQLALPQLPIDFEASGIDYTWTTFGNADFGPIPVTVIANPDMSGINTSMMVTQFEKPAGAQTFAGGSLTLSGPIDWTGGTTVTLKAWSPRAGVNFLVKIEDTTSPPDGNGNPTVFAEVQATTTVANQWEELSFDMTSFGAFSTDIDYNRIVVFPDFGAAGAGELFFVDDLATTTGGGGGGSSVAEIDPFDFENSVGFTGVFESGDGVTGQIIANPDTNGNPSANVYEFNKVTGAAWYSGMFNVFDTDIDFSSKTTFTIKIWSPKAGINVRFQLEKEGGGGGPTVSLDQTVANANEWTTLTFDFSGVVNPSEAYDKIVIFPDFDDVAQAPADGSIYYIDDVTQQ